MVAPMMSVSSFLSTLPARGATSADLLQKGFLENFYPRSPRGERPPYSVSWRSPPSFLSTLPARGATIRTSVRNVSIRFLSTLPARGATLQYAILLREAEISIHAPREGSDNRP